MSCRELKDFRYLNVRIISGFYNNSIKLRAIKEGLMCVCVCVGWNHTGSFKGSYENLGD